MSHSHRTGEKAPFPPAPSPPCVRLTFLTTEPSLTSAPLTSSCPQKLNLTWEVVGEDPPSTLLSTKQHCRGAALLGCSLASKTVMCSTGREQVPLPHKPRDSPGLVVPTVPTFWPRARPGKETLGLEWQPLICAKQPTLARAQ